MKARKDRELIFSKKDIDRLFAGYETRLRALEEQIVKKDAYIAVLEARIVELEKALKAPTKTSKNSSSAPHRITSPIKQTNKIAKKRRERMDTVREGVVFMIPRVKYLR